jgi:hypothetical protein
MSSIRAEPTPLPESPSLVSHARGTRRVRAAIVASALLAALVAPPGRVNAETAADSTFDHSMHGAHHHMGHDLAADASDLPGMEMNGMYGPYPMTREASGTAWQPDAAQHQGIHAMLGDWMLMVHGMGDLVVDHQRGVRGDKKTYSDNMLMGMAQRSFGPVTLGLRSMFSLEPATIGKEGYPLLLQTGETADGITPLIDRQHPHDLFMELAATLSVARDDRSLFVYGGLPGEPALGPPAFMHRFSAMSIPMAPITHHWLDSTHITYGVLTVGAVVDRIKVEASAFRGREPDENRWDIEKAELDSHSFRVSVNPTPSWSLQLSHGHIESPEELEPDVNQERTTATAIYDAQWDDGHWEVLLGWGRDQNRPGHTLGALTVEATAEVFEAHTMFFRAERVQKDELFLPSDPRAGFVFSVGELTAGYRFDFWRVDHFAAGVGFLGTAALIPESLREAYGQSPTSGALFLHVGLR